LLFFISQHFFIIQQSSGVGGGTGRSICQLDH